MDPRSGAPRGYLPAELSVLLRAADNGDETGAEWAAFLARHSPLLLRAVQSRNGDQDQTMDRYTFLIDQLRADDFRRLRGYQPDGRTKFTTWLVVVAKRLMVDHHRRRYGRPQGNVEGQRTRETQEIRRALVDMVGGEVDVDSVADSSGAGTDSDALGRERRAILQDAVRTLDSDDRFLLTLRFVDDATARDIVDVMGFPSQFHVYRALRRITRHLRRVLLARGITSSHDL